MHTVALAIHDGVLLFEAAAAGEVFGVMRPGLPEPWYDFWICGPRDAQVGGWLSARPDHDLDALTGADTVIVPAIEDIESPPPDLVTAIAAAHAAGARVISLCTGAFVLAEAGLLDGRRATTHWAHTDLLAARYPAVRVDPNVLYTDEGTVLTSAGKAAGIDLCLHVIRLDHGATVANELARRLVVPPHRSGGQAQYIPRPLPPVDTHALTDVLHWATAQLDQPLTVPDLARRAGMSPRHLTRRFTATTGTTPLRWLLAQRIHRAQELLETTDDTLDRIATRTGLGSAATLRRHIIRALGVPPETYRRTFRTRDGGAPAHRQHPAIVS